MAEELLAGGADVMVEKPITTTLDEADRLVAVARAGKRVLQVGHIERFNPAVAAVRPLVTDVKFIEAHRLGVFVPRALDVDVVLDLLVHDLDIALDLVGKPVVEIRAVGVPILSEKIDIASVRLLFEGGCVANLTASRVSQEKTRKFRFFQPDWYFSIDTQARDVTAFRLDRISGRAADRQMAGRGGSRRPADGGGRRVPPGLPRAVRARGDRRGGAGRAEAGAGHPRRDAEGSLSGRRRIGLVGGSGLYGLPGLAVTEEVRLETPFGEPSDAWVLGELSGVPVAFLARHGRKHRLLPSEDQLPGERLGVPEARMPVPPVGLGLRLDEGRLPADGRRPAGPVPRLDEGAARRPFSGTAAPRTSRSPTRSRRS